MHSANRKTEQTVDVGLRRYQAGVGDYLTVLTAQLWSAAWARQALLALQLTDFTNRMRSGSRWAAACHHSSKNNMARVSLSWALILGFAAGIGRRCVPAFVAGLPGSERQPRP